MPPNHPRFRTIERSIYGIDDRSNLGGVLFRISIPGAEIRSLYVTDELLDITEISTMPLFKIPISDLRKHVNPMDGTMWKCRPIDDSEIALALHSEITELRRWDDVVNTLNEAESRRFHISRIATVVKSPSLERIVVVVENHIAPVRVYLNDGNHRLAAAYVRGDEEIAALVAASAPDSVLEIFPGARPID
jgi:hypothetical protein